MKFYRNNTFNLPSFSLNGCFPISEFQSCLPSEFYNITFFLLTNQQNSSIFTFLNCSHFRIVNSPNQTWHICIQCSSAATLSTFITHKWRIYIKYIYSNSFYVLSNFLYFQFWKKIRTGFCKGVTTSAIPDFASTVVSAVGLKKNLKRFFAYLQNLWPAYACSHTWPIGGWMDWL